MFHAADPFLRQARYINYIVADTISLGLNFILLFLVLTKSRSGLKPYKKVLIFSILIDAMYAFFALLNQAVSFRFSPK